jgi:transposase
VYVSSSKQSPEHDRVVPVDPAPRPTRRTFTAEYKARVVAEYEAAPHGEKSAVLRREGLFHSHVREWVIARDAGPETGTSSHKSSSSGRMSRSERETQRLQSENARLKAKLAQTTAALAIMGKAHELLASLAESSDTTTSSDR